MCLRRAAAPSVALTASADEQRYAALSTDTYFSSLARFRCRRSASVSRYRERSHWLHTKCINSGAKPAYCAAKHINHSSDQRSNEAPATNDAVVPRARRQENRPETRPYHAEEAPASGSQPPSQEAPASAASGSQEESEEDEEEDEEEEEDY